MFAAFSQMLSDVGELEHFYIGVETRPTEQGCRRLLTRILHKLELIVVLYIIRSATN
jgi:hypothetical protein